MLSQSQIVPILKEQFLSMLDQLEKLYYEKAHMLSHHSLAHNN